MAAAQGVRGGLQEQGTGTGGQGFSQEQQNQQLILDHLQSVSITVLVNPYDNAVFGGGKQLFTPILQIEKLRYKEQRI